VVARTERFVRTLARPPAATSAPLEYADLRHADGYAVRLRGVTTTVPPAPLPDARRRPPAKTELREPHMAKEYKDLVFGLDIGTAKVMVVAAEVMPDGELRVAGLGVAPTHGLKRGVVVNIDATVPASSRR
jgi:hypothetical protein